jgi:hypothetical protein
MPVWGQAQPRAVPIERVARWQLTFDMEQSWERELTVTAAAPRGPVTVTDVGDREINAYWIGWRWPSGSINTQDWSCGAKGKQWKGDYGCVE